MRLLLNPDPASGSDNPVTEPGTPAPPAAAETVVTGTIDERIADLESELQVARTERDNERGAKTKLEKDISVLQDKLDALRKLQGLPGNPAPPAPTVTGPSAPVEEEHWTKTFGL